MILCQGKEETEGRETGMKLDLFQCDLFYNFDFIIMNDF